MSTAALASPNHPRGIATVGYSTELPADYYGRWTRYGYELSLDGYGQISGDGADENGYYQDEASAAFDAQDHVAELAAESVDQDEAKAAAEEAAADTHAKLAQAVADFLWAADRGRFGEALRCDGHDSAYVTDLRDKLAAVQATVALTQQVAA